MAGSRRESSPPIRVLVVDDNDLSRRSLTRCCEVPDLLVVGEAASATEALDAAADQGPDVVLIDYRLGDDNGVEVAEQVLRKSPGSKVLVVTGDATAEMREAASRAGCSGCIEKALGLASSLPEVIRRVHAGERV
jgi:DNA-binding NarL/FixJ family response regulator